MFATLTEKLIAGALAVLMILGAFGAYTFHERAEGKAAELATLQKSSTKLVNEANTKIATLTAAHAAELKKVLDDHATQITAANAQHDSDTQRLRDADAYRRQHSSVQSAAQPAGTTPTGTDGPSEIESRFERLEQLGSSLADALRYTDAALSACMTERDSVASPLF